MSFEGTIGGTVAARWLHVSVGLKELLRGAAAKGIGVPPGRTVFLTGVDRGSALPDGENQAAWL